MSTDSKTFRAKVTSLKQSNSVRRNWVYYPAHGEPLTDILEKSDYWAHIANQLTVGDWIELCAEDESYWALVRVIAVGNVWAKVMVIQAHMMEDVPASGDLDADPEYTIAWKGPKARFAVVRLKDKQVLKSEFHNKGDAQTWLAQHMKSVAA